jgi:hypothetical protein
MLTDALPVMNGSRVNRHLADWTGMLVVAGAMLRSRRNQSGWSQVFPITIFQASSRGNDLVVVPPTQQLGHNLT